MALETASFIDDLNTSNPAPTDLLGQGDDHIRLIKSVLKATFPNITGAVTLTQADINGLAASISASGVPVGVISAWYAAVGSVPAGWAVCDGSTVPLSDGSGNIVLPDLRNLVIIGAGSVAPFGTLHGAATASATSGAAGGHSHATTAGEGGHAHAGVSVANHALTINEMPAHTHTTACGSSEGDNSSNFTNGGGSVGSPVTTSSAGSGDAHGHGISWPTTPDGTHTHTTDAVAAHQHGVTVDTYQPSLALHYIMKV